MCEMNSNKWKWCPMAAFIKWEWGSGPPTLKKRQNFTSSTTKTFREKPV